MSTTLSTRIKCLAVLALAMAVEGVEAQYGYPYGYRRRRTGGWRNIYLVAILIRECRSWLLLCVFRAGRLGVLVLSLTDVMAVRGALLVFLG